MSHFLPALSTESQLAYSRQCNALDAPKSKYCCDKSQMITLLSLITAVAGIAFALFEESMIGAIGFVLLGVSTFIFRCLNNSKGEETALGVKKIAELTTSSNRVISAKSAEILGLQERIRALEGSNVQAQAQQALLQQSMAAQTRDHALAIQDLSARLQLASAKPLNESSQADVEEVKLLREHLEILQSDNDEKTQNAIAVKDQLDLLGQALSAGAEESKTLKETISLKDEENAALIATHEAQSGQFAIDLSELRQKVQGLREERDTYLEELTTQTTLTEEFKDRLIQSQSEVEKLSAEEKKLTEQLQTLVDQSESAREKSTAQITDLSTDLERKKEDLNELISTHKQLTEKLRVAEISIQDLTEKLAQVSTLLSQKEQEHQAALLEVRATTEKKINLLTKEMVELKDKLQVQKETIEHKDNFNAQLEKSSWELIQVAETSQAQITEFKNQIFQLQGEREALKKQHEQELVERRDQHEKIILPLRQQLESKGLELSQKTQGILALDAKRVNLEKELAALASAGEKLDQAELVELNREIAEKKKINTELKTEMQSSLRLVQRLRAEVKKLENSKLTIREEEEPTSRAATPPSSKKDEEKQSYQTAATASS